MRGLAILAVLLGLLAVWSVSSKPYADQSQVDAAATSFAVYRNEVVREVLADASITSATSRAFTPSNLPTGYQAMHSWQAQVDSGLCYVFGPATSAEAGAIRQLLHWSQAIGINQAGYLAPGLTTPLPSWIPNGYVVSVTGIGR